MPTETTTRAPSARPTPQPRAVVCPYCGTVSGNTTKCDRCAGRFDPLSRQATQNAMGPWRLRDEAVPTRPGCSYETIRRLVEGGRITRSSVIAGPTTRQFWMLAGRVPGVAHLLGVCHSCQAEVEAGQYACTSCGAVFEVDKDRQHLGLGPARLLPGHGSPERIAAFSKASHAAVEQPEWSWSGGVGSIGGETQIERVERAPRVQEEEDRVGDGTARARSRRLERRVASQQRMIQTLIVICVVLVGGLLALAFISRFQGSRATGPGATGPAMQPSQIESLSPAPAAGAPETDPQAESLDAPAIDEADETLSPPDDAWAVVRARVLTHVEQGTDEALTAAVLELESLDRMGGLPAEGVELLERLRTELEARQIRSLP